jgi:hypothetical protein
MSAPAHTQFQPSTVAIATVASVILSRPANMAVKMTYEVACQQAYTLLLAARKYQDERAELIASGKVAE